MLPSRQLWAQGPHIVAIGGGTGLSTMLRGLKKYTKNLTAIVTVSDDGLGMEQEALERLNDQLAATRLDYVRADAERQGGIALVNVNNRIKLLFGEQYGLCIYSTPGVGTDVEITLPRTTRDARVTG